MQKINNTAELGNILTLSTFGKKHRPDSQECQNGNCEPSPLGTCTLPALTPRPTATNTSCPSRVHYNQLGESGAQRCSGTDTCQARKGEDDERASDRSVNVTDRKYLAEEVDERFVVTGRTIDGNKGGSDMGGQGHVSQGGDGEDDSRDAIAAYQSLHSVI